VRLPRNSGDWKDAITEIASFFFSTGTQGVNRTPSVSAITVRPGSPPVVVGPSAFDLVLVGPTEHHSG
jgi:hypothetical protein